MSKSLNKVQIIGNLTDNPNIKTFENGNRIANLSVALNRQYKDSMGEVQKVTTYMDVEVKSPILVDLCDKFLKKGSRVYVEGSLNTRQYTNNDSQNVRVTEIVVPPYSGEIILL